MLEITCQDSDVFVVPAGDKRIIRAVDALAGIAVNIPLTAAALAALVTDSLTVAAA